MSENYFEGWYFKHQKEDKTICFIPGRSKDSAFVQVITSDFSKVFEFPLDRYKLCEQVTQIRVGDNLFCPQGCIIQLSDDDMTIRGRLSYGRITPLKTDIMGIFKYVPGMECRHGVVSMDHNVTGTVEIDGSKIDLTGGKGYIESDRGISFPKWYLWCQCNSFDTKTAIMIAVAKVPFLGLSFTGTLASVFYHGKEYRFATYLGARVIECGSRGVVIKQGRWKLEALFDSSEGYKLSAPTYGEMTRIVREQVNVHIQFKMFIDGVPYFNLHSDRGCVEYVAPTEAVECVNPIEI